jgi:hypothetical protein
MTAPMREGRQARVAGLTVPFDGGYQFSASAVEFESCLLRRYATLAVRNLRRRPVRTGLTVAGSPRRHRVAGWLHARLP